MKIYTRKGDTGQTSLIGGTRVSKADLRIESYGTVDELNSYLGWLRDLAGHDVVITEIQDRLFTIGSLLANDDSKMKLPQIIEDDIVFLEKQIDKMDAELPEMKNFILPGGHPAVSCAHVARCICRRAERLVVHLSEITSVDPVILKYLNRLSDYLFVFARFTGMENNVSETFWKPRL